MNTRFKVCASYNILQYLCDFIYVLIFVTNSKCRKSPKLTDIVILCTQGMWVLFGLFFMFSNFLPVKFAQRNSSCISKFKMKHHPESDWTSNLPRFCYGYLFRACVFLTYHITVVIFLMALLMNEFTSIIMDDWNLVNSMPIIATMFGINCIRPPKSYQEWQMMLSLQLVLVILDIWCTIVFSKTNSIRDTNYNIPCSYWNFPESDCHEILQTSTDGDLGSYCRICHYNQLHNKLKNWS